MVFFLIFQRIFILFFVKTFHSYFVHISFIFRSTMIADTEKKVECYECERTVPQDSTQRVEIYPRPWDETSTEIYLCSESPCDGNDDENDENDENDGISCYERFFNSNGDFPYVECPECLRLVCFRNPGNGYMGQFRTAPKYHDSKDNSSDNDSSDNDSNDKICLQCYEKVIMDKGQPRSDFESGHIGGGMFYNAIEWKEGGYQKMPEYDHAYIRSSSDAGKYNKRARDLIDEGAQVITGFDSIGMGLEGYITMFARLPKTKESSLKKSKK